MIEIGCDRDRRVFVRWHGGGPWTVLADDGSVTTEPHDLGVTQWFAGPSPDDAYDEHIALVAAQAARDEARPAGAPPPRPAARRGAAQSGASTGKDSRA